MFSCVLSLSHVVSRVRCGTWLYRFLIFAFLLTLLSYSPTGRVQIVKMLITLEPHVIFGPNYEYLYIFTLSRHCWFSYKIYWNIVQPLECKMGRSSHFSENAHNSWTTRNNFDKNFAYLYILTLSRHCWFNYKSDVHLPFLCFCLWSNLESFWMCRWNESCQLLKFGACSPVYHPWFWSHMKNRVIPDQTASSELCPATGDFWYHQWWLPLQTVQPFVY